MSKKVFDQLIEEALARVLAQHLTDPLNNPVNTAVFGSTEFQDIIYTLDVTTANVVSLAKTITTMLQTINAQNERIKTLADCIGILTSRLEKDSRASGLDVSLSVTQSKPEKPN